MMIFLKQNLKNSHKIMVIKYKKAYPMDKPLTFTLNYSYLFKNIHKVFKLSLIYICVLNLIRQFH